MTEPAISKNMIMVVDDDPVQFQLLKEILDPFGFKFVYRESGSEAIDYLSDSLPEIILLDVIMPDMDGFEICRRLKADERTRSIPIILMTALTETVNKVTGLELGAADYLTKPFQKEEVLTRIKNQFVMRQLQQQLLNSRRTIDEKVNERTQAIARSNEQLKKELDEHKRMEKIMKQAQKMEAISTLSTGIAHDFNNILSIIIGSCEMADLEGAKEDSNIGACLEKINSAAFRARELVQNLLTFCRQTEQEKTHIKVSPILKYVLEVLKNNISPDIYIETEIEEETGMVLADPSQIHQLIFNLCQNAGQAMVDNGGTLSVRLDQIFLDPDHVSEHPNLVPGDYISIFIQDTGSGMDNEVLERIFDPYFTTKEPGEGTGLGMAVAHGIAVSHGGTIEVNSKPGQGSSFQVLLPCRKTKKFRAELKGDPSLPIGSGNILFVDDEEALVEFGTIVLERGGYHVEGFTNSLDALEAFSAAPGNFDIVVTDHIMPKMQGMDLAKKILEIKKDTPILLCTGTKSDEMVEQAKSLGIKAVIQKPILIKSLIKALKHILEKD